jgi:hypothetical protein
LVRKAAHFTGLASQESYPPGWGLGGVIANTGLGADEIQSVFTDLATQPVIRTLVRPNPLVSPVWEATRPFGVTSIALTSHVLDLEGGFETVWRKRFHHTNRTAIHKAEHSDLTVMVDSTGELLPVYYQIFIEWCARRGRERHLPAWFSRWNNQRRDPLDRLQRIFKALDTAAQVYVAYLGDQPIAAAILLIYRENAVYLRGTSLRAEAGPVRANDLSQSRMIEAACQAGCRFYHMGTSAGVESLMRFKSGFGAEPTPLYNYAIERFPITSLGIWRYRLFKVVENQLMRPGYKFGREKRPGQQDESPN